MSTLLTCAEPPLAKRLPDEHHSAGARIAIVLTIEQKMQIDTFLATFSTWTVGAAAKDASWQVTSCFAPRLHRNGEIDFIAPYLAGSQALALITAHPVITFLVSDQGRGSWLEGCAQTMSVQRSWEHAELLAYLRWRVPHAIDGSGDAVEVMVFRPIYLRYCDSQSNDGSFELT